MKKISLKQKIILILLGLSLSVVLLETGLRIGGTIYFSLQRYRNKISIQQKKAYRIMCLGESTTALGGKYSYPRQLEKILNGKNIGAKFSVVNEGIPGTTTKTIVARLENNLDRYNPDIITVMMGINDEENLLPYKNHSVSFFKTDNLGRILWRHIAPKIRKLNISVTNYLKKYVVSSWVHKAQRGYDKAEGRVNKGIDTEPKDDRAYSELGWCHLKQKHYDEAEKMFKMAMEMNEKNILAYNGLGWCYNEQGRYTKAEEMFKRAIEINPENGKTYRGLGKCYMNQRIYDKAEEMFKRAIEINPENGKTYRGLGKCYMNQRIYDKAEEMYKRAIEIDPKKVGAYCMLGWIYMDQCEYTKAEEMYKRAIKIDPKTGEAYRMLASLYMDQGEYTKAEGILKKAIETDPQSDSIYSALGSLYERQGRDKLAATCFQKANELRSEFYNSITWRNYEKLKNIVRRRGIKLVCVQYPMRSVEPLKKMLKSKEDVIFVDNEVTFKKAVKQSQYSDYFVDAFGSNFGHCTPRGNRLLAENIGRAILEQCFNID